MIDAFNPGVSCIKQCVKVKASCYANEDNHDNTSCLLDEPPRLVLHLNIFYFFIFHSGRFCQDGNEWITFILPDYV